MNGPDVDLNSQFEFDAEMHNQYMQTRMMQVVAFFIQGLIPLYGMCMAILVLIYLAKPSSHTTEGPHVNNAVVDLMLFLTGQMFTAIGLLAAYTVIV